MLRSTLDPDVLRLPWPQVHLLPGDLQPDRAGDRHEQMKLHVVMRMDIANPVRGDIDPQYRGRPTR